MTMSNDSAILAACRAYTTTQASKRSEPAALSVEEDDALEWLRNELADYETLAAERGNVYTLERASLKVAISRLSAPKPEGEPCAWRVQTPYGVGYTFDDALMEYFSKPNQAVNDAMVIRACYAYDEKTASHEDPADYPAMNAALKAALGETNELA